MKQVFTISTDVTPSPENSQLSVRIGERHVGFALTDLENGSLQSLAWFTGEKINQPELDEMYRLHPELSLAYTRIRVCYDHAQSMLIPFTFFREDTSRQMLETGFGITDFDEVFTDTVSSWQIYNAYAVPQDIHQWTARTFTSAHYFHQYSVAIRSMQVSTATAAVAVDFRQDEFTVVIRRNSDLMLAQTFPYSSPSDVIYYLLKCTKEFNLPADSTTVSISGMVDKQSILYRELYQYFLGIEIRQPQWPAIEGGNYPSHFFTSLNDLALCES